MSTNSASNCLSLSQRERTETGRIVFQLSRQAPKLGSQLDGSSRNRGRPNKTPESKARRRPNLPCAWHFALYRFCQRESQLYLSSPTAQGTRLPRHPKIKEITNSTRNIKDRSFAMPADVAAIPPNPKTAATSAMIKNTTAHPNISSPPQRLNRICRIIRAPQGRCSVETGNSLTVCPSRKHHFV